MAANARAVDCTMVSVASMPQLGAETVTDAGIGRKQVLKRALSCTERTERVRKPVPAHRPFTVQAPSEPLLCSQRRNRDQHRLARGDETLRHTRLHACHELRRARVPGDADASSAVNKGSFGVSAPRPLRSSRSVVANSAGVASPGSVSGVPVLALNVQVKGRSADLLVPSEPLPGFYRRSGRGRPRRHA
jgi:hypothetical protein